MTKHIDPAKDPNKDPRRLRFEKMQQDGTATYDEVMKLVQEFIALGHNPKDPTDEMYVILGITPEFLETMLFTLRTQPTATLDEFSIIPDAEDPLAINAPTHPSVKEVEAKAQAIPMPKPAEQPAPAPEDAPEPLAKQA